MSADQIRINANLLKVQPSASSHAAQRVREMRAEGRDVIGLSIGEPDFPTPDHVIEAAFEAARRGETRYTNSAGIPPLKAAVREKFKRENGLEYADDEVMIGNGGKQLLYDVILSTIEAGDEVIIPAPYWLAYIELVVLGGGKPVIVSCGIDEGFKLTPSALERAITPKTRWLVLNSPCNPSGAVYTADELKGLAEVLLRHPHVAILSDDMYEHVLFDGASFSTMAQVVPELKERTVTVNGASKVYSMTGWRIGYCGGPAYLIKQMTKLQQQATGSVCSVSQAAALAALTGPQDFVAKRSAIFQDRRDLVVSMLNQAKGLTCPSPAGAFYVFPHCGALIGKKTPEGKVIENDFDLCMYILESEGVAVVHGGAYGLSPHFRVSFAASEEELRTACERIQRACAALS